MTKILTTVALLGGAILPILMDAGPTHLFNSHWDAHARSHLVWMLATNFFLFWLAVYHLWYRKEEVLPGLISLCILLGYSVSAITMPLYDGVFLGEGGVEPRPFGIPINLIWFSALLIIQMISLFLVYRRRKQARGRG